MLRGPAAARPRAVPGELFCLRRGGSASTRATGGGTRGRLGLPPILATLNLLTTLWKKGDAASMALLTKPVFQHKGPVSNKASERLKGRIVRLLRSSKEIIWGSSKGQKAGKARLAP